MNVKLEYEETQNFIIQSISVIERLMILIHRKMLKKMGMDISFTVAR